MERKGKLAADFLVWVLLLGVPYWLPLVGGYVELGSRVIIYALAAMALNFLLGFTGVLSFGHAAYFGLGAYCTAITIKYLYPSTPVATTEPVGDYMLQAAGTVNLTPFSLQADVMNGVDPAPQNITLQNQLFSQHRVKVFLYNRQVTDTLTQSFLHAAAGSGTPVVGLYETMPTGYRYQTWMLAEVQALRRAVSQRISTERL